MTKTILLTLSLMILTGCCGGGACENDGVLSEDTVTVSSSVENDLDTDTLPTDTIVGDTL